MSSSRSRSAARALLGSTSLAALLLGAPGPAGAGQMVTSPQDSVVNPAGTTTDFIAITGTTVTHAVTNAGTIAPGVPQFVGSLGAPALLISNGTIGGGVVNTGTISASAGKTQNFGIDIEGSTLSAGVRTTGSIAASTSAPAGSFGRATGIFLDGGTFSGGIANGGTISTNASGGSAESVGMFVIANLFSGDIVNRADIAAIATATSRQSLAEAAGIVVHAPGGFAPTVAALVPGGRFTGSVINAGTITATAAGPNEVFADGILVQAFGGFGTGGLANSISAGGTVTGTLANRGVITVSASGASDGFQDEGAFGMRVQFLSPIPSAGVTTTPGTFAGSVDNSGTITAAAKGGGLGAFGIFVGPTSNHVVQSGVFTGAVTNSGAIAATGTAGASGVGIKALNAIPGGIANTGTVFGSTAAIDVSQEIGGATAVTQSAGTLIGSILGSGNGKGDALSFTGGSIVLAPGQKIAGFGSVAQSGGTLLLQVNESAAPSVSAGALRLGGALQIAPQGGVIAGGVYRDVFTAATPIAGSFAAVTATPFLTASLAPEAATANALDLAVGLSRAGADASAQDLTQSLRFGLETNAVLTQTVQHRLLSGSAYDGGGIATAALAGGALQIAGGAGVLSDGGAGAAARGGAWARGYGVLGNADASGAAAGYRENRAGLIAGADWQAAPGWVLGLAGGYADTTADFADATRTAVHSYEGTAYAGWRQGPWYATASAGLGFNTYTTTRQLAAIGLSGTATSNPSGQSYTGYGEAGYRLEEGAATLTPFLGLGYVHTRIDGFTEEGGFGALAVDAATSRSLATSLGIRASTRLDLGGIGSLVPELRLGWSHEFLDAAQTIAASLAGVPGSAFSATGANFGRDSALVGIGITHDLGREARLFLDYDGKLSQGLQEHAISGGLRLDF
ncbi:MAG: autotransporter outer membrane beta-barrel domain-containing protein [Alphaproteobacteria bacterium]|nr:autotransporter outer membrane beta-barrel domain-containing protein [Alphaproteobacteria bacterium]